jgi:hypothetical protein
VSSHNSFFCRERREGGKGGSGSSGGSNHSAAGGARAPPRSRHASPRLTSPHQDKTGQAKPMKDGEGELDRSEGNGAMFNAEEAYQGKVKGLIQPPPDIRAVADKTARFVAKNGKGFEQRILASEEGQSSKFNFMRPHDPYYAYYEAKIREFEEVPDGQPTPAAPSAPAPAATSEPSGATESRQDEVAPAKAAVQRKAVSDPIAKVAKTLDREKEPAAFVFSSIRPTGLTALDIDMIKLTAQYTAAGGRNFLSVLAKREADNEQYQVSYVAGPKRWWSISREMTDYDLSILFLFESF